MVLSRMFIIVFLLFFAFTLSGCREEDGNENRPGARLEGEDLVEAGERYDNLGEVMFAVEVATRQPTTTPTPPPTATASATPTWTATPIPTATNTVQPTSAITQTSTPTSSADMVTATAAVATTTLQPGDGAATASPSLALTAFPTPSGPTPTIDPTAVASGRNLFISLDCATCYPGGRAGTGPSVVGLQERAVELQSGETINLCPSLLPVRG